MAVQKYKEAKKVARNEEMERLYKSGLSTRKVAKKISEGGEKVSAMRVWQILHQRGIL